MYFSATVNKTIKLANEVGIQAIKAAKQEMNDGITLGLGFFSAFFNVLVTCF